MDVDENLKFSYFRINLHSHGRPQISRILPAYYNSATIVFLFQFQICESEGVIVLVSGDSLKLGLSTTIASPYLDSVCS